MDRIDAMKVFVAAVDERSLAGAARRLGRSPAAVSRAMAFLEDHVGTPLLHRTSRSLRLSEAGERYVLACRRVLSDLEEADIAAAGERGAPRGLLTLTAPVAAGEDLLRPVIDAFTDAYPAVTVRLHLFDRQLSLIEEGVDMALRIARLPDSSHTAFRIGQIRRVVVASPAYLSRHPKIDDPSDLAKHKIIAMTHFGLDSWSFPPFAGSAVPRAVQFSPRLVVNTVRAAMGSACEGHGVTRLYCYHVARQIQQEQLRVVLEGDDDPQTPVSLISPQGRLSVPKVRAFADFAVPRLQARLALLTGETNARLPKDRGEP